MFLIYVLLSVISFVFCQQNTADEPMDFTVILAIVAGVFLFLLLLGGCFCMYLKKSQQRRRELLAYYQQGHGAGGHHHGMGPPGSPGTFHGGGGGGGGGGKTTPPPYGGGGRPYTSGHHHGPGPGGGGGPGPAGGGGGGLSSSGNWRRSQRQSRRQSYSAARNGGGGGVRSRSQEIKYEDIGPPNPGIVAPRPTHPYSGGGGGGGGYPSSRPMGLHSRSHSPGASQSVRRPSRLNLNIEDDYNSVQSSVASAASMMSPAVPGAATFPCPVCGNVYASAYDRDIHTSLRHPR